MKTDDLKLFEPEINTAITDAFSKHVVDPATGQEFTPEKAQAFLGPHLPILTSLAAGLAADNPNDAKLQMPGQAAQVALSLAFNPKNPNQPMFRVLGQTAGGNGIVVQTDDNPPQKFAMSRQNFGTLVGTMRQLQQNYIGQRNQRTEQEGKNKSNWQTVKDTASENFDRMRAPGNAGERTADVAIGLAKAIGDRFTAPAVNPNTGPNGYGDAGQPYQMPTVNSGNPGQDTPQQNSTLTNVLGRIVGASRSVQEAVQQIQQLGLEARGYDLSQGSQLVQYITQLLQDRFNPYGGAGEPYRLPVVNSGDPRRDTLPRTPSRPVAPAVPMPARPYSPDDYGSAGVPYRMPVVNSGN